MTKFRTQNLRSGVTSNKTKTRYTGLVADNIHKLSQTIAKWKLIKKDKKQNIQTQKIF